MTTAYNACKAKLQKGKDPRILKAPLVPELVCGMMDKALTKIKTIDTSDWSEADKTNFSTILISLKTEIDTYLSAQNQATPA